MDASDVGSIHHSNMYFDEVINGYWKVLAMPVTVSMQLWLRSALNPPCEGSMQPDAGACTYLPSLVIINR
jgi:hypothetical protein